MFHHITRANLHMLYEIHDVICDFNVIILFIIPNLPLLGMKRWCWKIHYFPIYFLAPPSDRNPDAAERPDFTQKYFCPKSERPEPGHCRAAGFYSKIFLPKTRALPSGRLLPMTKSQREYLAFYFSS